MVSDEAEALDCDYCTLWIHEKCHGVSCERYKLAVKLSRIDKGDLFCSMQWFCNMYNSHAVSTIKLIQILKDNQEQM